MLAVTLGGLTTGYFLGGWTTYRYPAMKMLIGVLLAGTVLIAIMPLLALNDHACNQRRWDYAWDRWFPVPCSCSLPLVCMGMVSPAIIQISNRELKVHRQDRRDDLCYFNRRGIVMTLLMGFFLLPDWGSAIRSI